MNLKGYPLSRDYALLATLMRTQTILCVGQWAKDRFRTPALTLFDSAKGNDGRQLVGYHERRGAGWGDWQRFRVIAPGEWQVDATDEAEFSRQCERMYLEFVLPKSEIPVQSDEPPAQPPGIVCR